MIHHVYAELLKFISPSMRGKAENCGGKMKLIFLDCSETLNQIKSKSKNAAKFKSSDISNATKHSCVVHGLLLKAGDFQIA